MHYREISSYLSQNFLHNTVRLDRLTHGLDSRRFPLEEDKKAAGRGASIPGPLAPQMIPSGEMHPEHEVDTRQAGESTPCKYGSLLSVI